MSCTRNLIAFLSLVFWLYSQSFLYSSQDEIFYWNMDSPDITRALGDPQVFIGEKASFVDGKSGLGITFENEGSYAEIKEITDFNPDAGIVSFAFYPINEFWQSKTNDLSFFSDVGRQLSLDYKNGTFVVTINDLKITLEPVSLKLNRWYRLLFSWNKFRSDFRFTVNGKSLGIQEVRVDKTMKVIPVSHLIVGNRGVDALFNAGGVMDELKIFRIDERELDHIEEGVLTPYFKEGVAGSFASPILPRTQNSEEDLLEQGKDPSDQDENGNGGNGNDGNGDDGNGNDGNGDG
ncbi:hypothetical protein IID04_07745, partial [PVC group bacterium]|nr:hypothetical protein [PVC group bacterium]